MGLHLELSNKNKVSNLSKFPEVLKDHNLAC